MTFGATPTDWAHWQTLGLESDLLPVVSNPAAKISEKSKMRDLGKTPSRYDQHGKVVGLPKWTSHVATDKDVSRWAQVSDLGICIQTRQVRAIDIDVADPVCAQRVRDLVELMVQLPQRRRPNSGKCLLAFRMPGEFAKRIIRTPDGIIEFLANGQQFIAIGTHPSGVRYEWVDVDGVLGLPDDVPELTPAEFEVLWSALVAAFALPDGETRTRNGMVPTKTRVASDLQDPAVAFLDENGWVTGYERDGRVDVRCPWEDGHSTDSGPTSTSYFPAGVGGFAQGHFRCLHASCSARTDGDFFEKVGYGADDFDVVETLANDKGEVSTALPPFTRARSGQIEPTINNVLMALRRPDVCGLGVSFDEFRAEILVDEDNGLLRPFNDRDYTRLCSRLEMGPTGFKSIETKRIRDAVQMVAWENKSDSAVNWLARLKWDGVPRVEEFFIRYFRTANTAYTRAVGLYTFTALAARVMTPGAKADMVPVLVGAQNAGKTTGVQAIAPHNDMFTEVSLDIRDDDLARKMRGTLVGEIGELRGLDSRDEEAIKQWITRTHEEWTPKYMEYVTKFPRRLVFFGTTNRDDFLVDETGNRRWLPMRVGEVDVPAIRRDCEQLWAEGRVRYELEGVAWQDAYELAKDQHSAFKNSDSWDEVVAEWLKSDDMEGPRGPQIRIVDVLVSALNYKAREIKKADEMRCGKVLARLGYVKATRWIGGRAQKIWSLSTSGGN